MSDLRNKIIKINSRTDISQNEKSKLTIVCPGVYFVMHKMYICMVGTK